MDNEIIKIAELTFSKQTMSKDEVIKVMNSINADNTWEEQNAAARTFLDNKSLFSNEEIIFISKDFTVRTGFKPRREIVR